MKNLILIIITLSICACSDNSKSNQGVVISKESNTATSAPFEPPVTPTVIPKKTIQLDKTLINSTTASNERIDYPSSNTTDGNNNTFVTTNTLTRGDSYVLYYEFRNAIDLARIEIIDNYTNEYNLGDLEVQISSNSTDGTNGTWETVREMNKKSSNFIDGDGNITINKASVKWLRLKMTFSGTGAFGGSPAFYMSEINFYHELAM